jgi:hypothetical protein
VDVKEKRKEKKNKKNIYSKSECVCLDFHLFMDVFL